MEIEIQTPSRKTLIISAAAVVVVIAAGLVLMTDDNIKERDEDLNYIVYDDGTVAVNDTAVLNESGWVEDPGTYQIVYGQYMTQLDLFGTYNGRTFYDTTYAQDGEVVMSLAGTMDPEDGILNGYMVGSMNGSKTDPSLVVDVYMDQEMRDAMDMEPRAVVWDQNGKEVSEYDINLTEINDGIYRGQLMENDTVRFLPGESLSGANILVGEVRKTATNDITSGDIYIGIE